MPPIQTPTAVEYNNLYGCEVATIDGEKLVIVEKHLFEGKKIATLVDVNTFEARAMVAEITKHANDHIVDPDNQLFLVTGEKGHEVYEPLTDEALKNAYIAKVKEVNGIK